jgi:purine-binding chemotaxis protein CheW
MPEISTVQEHAVFRVGDMLCGVDISAVQEINKHLEITTVYHAPKFVRGVLNLRGQIVTVIDLRNKFGLPSVPINEEMRIVIVRTGGENIGLLVDGVDDVVLANPRDLEAPPSNLGGISGDFFTSIYKTEEGLVALLDIEAILRQD